MLVLLYEKLNIMSDWTRKILDLIAAVVLTISLLWAFWSFLNGEVIFNLVFNDPQAFKNYLLNLGPWAAVTYIAAVMIEVIIAFIPGWFLYPVGGAVFGLWKTVLLILIANFLAATISFWIGRRWGLPLLNKFIAPRHIKQFHGFMERHGTLAVFLLKLNPITSLDIWNYVAGASPIRFWKFSIANLAGIAPLVFASAVLGEESFRVAPQILGVIFLATVLYLVWVLISTPFRKKIQE